MPTAEMFVFGSLMLLLPLGIIWILYRFLRTLPKAGRVLLKMNKDRLAERAEAERVEAQTRAYAGPYLHESACSDKIIALNREARQIILGTLVRPIYVPFESLRQAEVVMGKTTLTKADRSQARAFADGSAWSDTRALRQAALADRMSRDLITDLSIKVTVDNWDDPVHTIFFFQADRGGVDPRSSEGMAATALVEKIYGQLELILHDNDAEPQLRPSIDRD